MKRGFTLVEVVATIVILAIIGAIALPIVDSTIKENKESLYKSQLKEIEDATEKWAYQNMDLLPNIGEFKTIKLEELKKAGLLPLDIRDPRDNELLPNDMLITITLENSIYVFDVNEESGTDINSEYNANSPILILNGSPLEYLEFGDVYNELGAVAKDRSGNSIDSSNISIMYQYNGVEIASINSKEFKTYTVIYSVSSEVNGTVYTSNITRTIIVRDTTAPNLIVPGKVEIYLADALNYDLQSGVEVSDNSGEDIAVTITGFDASVGQKIVSYTACDSRNNCVTKKRIINILENEQ